MAKAKPVDFRRKKPKKAKRDPLAFDFGANVKGRGGRRGGRGGGS
jgi:hypothetical protein